MFPLIEGLWVCEAGCEQCLEQMGRTDFLMVIGPLDIRAHFLPHFWRSVHQYSKKGERFFRSELLCSLILSAFSWLSSSPTLSPNIKHTEAENSEIRIKVPDMPFTNCAVSWRRAWQPTPVFLSRESHGQKSLVGYSPRSCKESDTTEVT